jgi:hypothetical protein
MPHLCRHWIPPAASRVEPPSGPARRTVRLAEPQNFARANRRRRGQHEYVGWERACCWSASKCRCVMALSHDAAGCGQSASWRAGMIMRVRPSENGTTRQAKQQQFADVIPNHKTGRPQFIGNTNHGNGCNETQIRVQICCTTRHDCQLPLTEERGQSFASLCPGIPLTPIL